MSQQQRQEQQQQQQQQQQQRHLMSSLRKPQSLLCVGISPFLVLSHLIVAMASFQIGLLFGASGSNASVMSMSADTNSVGQLSCPPPPPCGPQITSPMVPVYTGDDNDNNNNHGKNDTKFQIIPVFPEATVGKWIAGAALVNRTDFTQQFDIGVPWDNPKIPGNSQILMLYPHAKSLPRVSNTAATTINSSSKLTVLPVYESAQQATEFCQVLKLILLQPDRKDECVALVGQWESHHVHKLMRLPPEPFPIKGGGKTIIANLKYPLRYVARHQQTTGKKQRIPDGDAITTGKYGEVLKDYLEKLPSTLKQLEPLAAKVAGNTKTVIVMVCNFGQSEIFLNFVCSARARGLDISQILLFATDSDIVELATASGVTVFDAREAFGDMPTNAARAYGDKAFTGTYVVLLNLIDKAVLHVFISEDLRGMVANTSFVFLSCN